MLKALSRDDLASRFCERPMSWGHKLSFITHEFSKDPRILNIVVTFVLTPWSHYNTDTEPHARFLFSQLEGLSIDFSSNMILSIQDMYQDNESHDKLIFPSAITCILMHAHVSIPSSTPFHVICAISKEYVVRSFTQLMAKAKRPRDDSTPVQ